MKSNYSPDKKTTGRAIFLQMDVKAQHHLYQQSEMVMTLLRDTIWATVDCQGRQLWITGMLIHNSEVMEAPQVSLSKHHNFQVDNGRTHARDNGEMVAEAIWWGKAIVVTDGSYKNEHGPLAFGVEEMDSRYRNLGVNITLGHPED